jgi:hypothetical protein
LRQYQSIDFGPQKPHKEHQSYAKINLVSAGRVREPDNVGSAASLK